RKINRRFQGFPFSRLVQLLEDKGAEVGLKVSVVPESYTSKCSFPDNEPVGKHLEYCGKRVARGLFKSASGLEINADLNGAYNIIRVKYPRFRMLFVPLHPRTHRIT
ncbi:MAG: zinc ribbon domain-containing protein, partial [Candidatus Hodarchaeota archaeon]